MERENRGQEEMKGKERRKGERVKERGGKRIERGLEREK